MSEKMTEQLSPEQYAEALRFAEAHKEGYGTESLACRALLQAAQAARRYRWLREKSSRQAMTGKKYAGQIQVVQWESTSEANVLTYKELDAAIDAAQGKAERSRDDS